MQRDTVQKARPSSHFQPWNTCVCVGACWNTDFSCACSSSRALRVLKTSFATELLRSVLCPPASSCDELMSKGCPSCWLIRNPELPGPHRKKRWNLTASQGGFSPKCSRSRCSRIARGPEHLRPPRLFFPARAQWYNGCASCRPLARRENSSCSQTDYRCANRGAVSNLSRVQ